MRQHPTRRTRRLLWGRRRSNAADGIVDAALFTLAFLTGVLLALGLARVGPLVRFVPNAVLTGFVNAIALNIVLGQLDDLTGYASEGSNRILRAIDTARSLTSWSSSAVRDYCWPGVSDQVYTQLRDTGAIDVIGRDNVFRATSSVGESAQRAMDAAHAWIDAPT